jgi:hypothetical protein
LTVDSLQLTAGRSAWNLRAKRQEFGSEAQFIEREERSFVPVESAGAQDDEIGKGEGQ